MARPLRIEYPGAFYLVTSRGTRQTVVHGVIQHFMLFYLENDKLSKLG